MRLADHPGFARIARRLAERGGASFQLYKEPCLARRLAVRMRARGTDDMGQYADLLDRDPEELDRLVDACAVTVTGFFRNPAAWRRLRGLVSQIRGAGGLTGWSAGCATGEEAFSLGMLFDRLAGAEGTWRVDATDIDAPALARAATGTYPIVAASMVEREGGRGYGARGDAGFVIEPRIRERVHFSRGDLLEGPPRPVQYDVVLCRNVLIYFAETGQRRILDRMANALAIGGLLMLGKAEVAIQELPPSLAPLDSKERIFRRVG